jgi:hypothetical protein
MSQVIDLQPGVDFFPSRRERRARKHAQGPTPPENRRGTPPRLTGKRMPITIDLSAIIEAIPHPLRNLVKLTAEELMRVRS